MLRLSLYTVLSEKLIEFCSFIFLQAQRRNMEEHREKERSKHEMLLLTRILENEEKSNDQIKKLKKKVRRMEDEIRELQDHCL